MFVCVDYRDIIAHKKRGRNDPSSVAYIPYVACHARKVTFYLFGYFGLLTTDVIFRFENPITLIFEGQDLDLIQRCDVGDLTDIDDLNQSVYACCG